MVLSCELVFTNGMPTSVHGRSDTTGTGVTRYMGVEVLVTPVEGQTSGVPAQTALTRQPCFGALKQHCHTVPIDAKLIISYSMSAPLLIA